MTVRRGPRRGDGARDASSTRKIFHVELRAGVLGEFLRHDAADDIGSRAGRIRHDHFHRPFRITPGRFRLRRGGHGA